MGASLAIKPVWQPGSEAPDKDRELSKFAFKNLAPDPAGNQMKKARLAERNSVGWVFLAEGNLGRVAAVPPIPTH
jgi:hypothetical protein